MRDKKELIGGFRKDFTGRSARQISTLYSTQILMIILGVVTRMVMTRSLEPADYGIFAFFVAVTTFTILFFRHEPAFLQQEIEARMRESPKVD